jgi:hypothetical protein
MVVPLRVSAIKLGLLPEFNIRLYDKNSESDYFFSSTKIRIFFSATERIRIFFISLEENHNTKNHNLPSS